jgi:hypothetical protein
VREAGDGWAGRDPIECAQGLDDSFFRADPRCAVSKKRMARPPSACHGLMEARETGLAAAVTTTVGDASAVSLELEAATAAAVARSQLRRPEHTSVSSRPGSSRSRRAAGPGSLRSAGSSSRSSSGSDAGATRCSTIPVTTCRCRPQRSKPPAPACESVTPGAEDAPQE